MDTGSLFPSHLIDQKTSLPQPMLSPAWHFKISILSMSKLSTHHVLKIQVFQIISYLGILYFKEMGKIQKNTTIYLSGFRKTFTVCLYPEKRLHFQLPFTLTQISGFLKKFSIVLLHHIYIFFSKNKRRCFSG